MPFADSSSHPTANGQPGIDSDQAVSTMSSPRPFAEQAPLVVNGTNPASVSASVAAAAAAAASSVSSSSATSTSSQTMDEPSFRDRLAMMNNPSYFLAPYVHQNLSPVDEGRTLLPSTWRKAENGPKGERPVHAAGTISLLYDVVKAGHRKARDGNRT